MRVVIKIMLIWIWNRFEKQIILQTFFALKTFEEFFEVDFRYAIVLDAHQW